MYARPLVAIATALVALQFLLVAPCAVGADKVAPITAMITIQDPEGTTESNLDLETLKRIEQWSVQTFLQKARASYAKQGFDPETFDPKLNVASVYLVAGGKKLAVIKMNMNDQARIVSVMGFHRGQFLRVACIRGSNHDIPLFSGECGQKVTEAFGVSIRPQVAPTADPQPLASADLNSKMIDAARAGHLALVASAVAKGADINARTSSGYSALSGASGKGQTEVVRFLLDKGVNVNESLRDGTNALDEASFWGHLATAQLLLARGANPNLKKDNGYTPLLSAAMNGHLEVVKLLLDKGADVNAKSKVGGTALHAAAVQKQIAVINLLLKRGANPEIRTASGYTYKDVLAARR